MKKSEQKRFSTFLLASGQRLKIVPPNDTNWDLIMINFISGIKPISIIQEISSTNSDTPIKSTFASFNEGEPDCQIKNYRLSNKTPFKCYLNKKKSYVQFVFASNSKEKLMVKQINQEHNSVGLSKNLNFENIFMSEIQRIVKSEHPLTLMSTFIKKYEIRPYFYVLSANFSQILSDSINFSLIQMSEEVVSTEISHYINFLDMQFVLGEELLLHDAIIIEKIINIYPQLKQKINHIIIHTKNFYVFACLLMEKNLFDFTLLCHHLNAPDKINIMISFNMLKIIVDEQVPISSSMMKMFTPYVKLPLLHMLLSSNKILSDSTVIPKQISNIAPPPSKAKLEVDNIIKFEINLVEAKTPETNITEKNVPQKNTANFRIQLFSPQKLTPKKKPQISKHPEWTFEIINKNSKQLKIARQDRFFLNKNIEMKNYVLSLSPNFVEYSYTNNKNNIQTKDHRERSSKQYNDAVIIILCSLFALISVIFIWTHFSFNVL